MNLYINLYMNFYMNCHGFMTSMTYAFGVCGTVSNLVRLCPGSELREIQKQIDNMRDKTSPSAVGQFLTLRRDVMFLEFDVAVRHCMRETFLATNNVAAYKVSGVRVTRWTDDRVAC